MAIEKVKRQGGQTIIKNSQEIWLVLTESTGKPGVGFKHKCGEKIMGARVAHPIWDGPFECSGSGQCSYQTVPYCPKCETKPNFSGAPIDVPFPGLSHKL